MLCSYGNSGIHITGLRSCYMERGFSKETCLDIEVLDNIAQEADAAKVLELSIPLIQN
jgi:hypothetical protein